MEKIRTVDGIARDLERQTKQEQTGSVTDTRIFVGGFPLSLSKEDRCEIEGALSRADLNDLEHYANNKAGWYKSTLLYEKLREIADADPNMRKVKIKLLVGALQGNDLLSRDGKETIGE